MADTGQYRDDHGDARCRDTDKLVLTYREARRRAKRAQDRDRHPAEAFHCTACCSWHWGHTPLERYDAGKGRKPRRNTKGRKARTRT